uniref:Protein kinase domain-containing protein n=1 Tax=Macrostomum lignano TaxID=282301 RepID=A0A1I8F4V0_9PLAT
MTQPAELEEGELTTQSVKFASCGLDGFRSSLGLRRQKLPARSRCASCLAAADAAVCDAAVRLLAVGCEKRPRCGAAMAARGRRRRANGVQCRPFGKDQGVNQVRAADWAFEDWLVAGVFVATRTGAVEAELSLHPKLPVAMARSAVLSFNPTASASSDSPWQHRLAAHTGEVVKPGLELGCPTCRGCPAGLGQRWPRDRLLKAVPPSLGKKRGWAQSDDRRYWCSLAWPRGQPLLFNTPRERFSSGTPGASAATLSPAHRLLGALSLPAPDDLRHGSQARDRLYTFGHRLVDLRAEPGAKPRHPAQLCAHAPPALPAVRPAPAPAAPPPWPPASATAASESGAAAPAPPPPTTLHWQGISGRVSAVALAPQPGGPAGIRTDAGQVGCVDNPAGRRPGRRCQSCPPVASHHKGCVYIVRWARRPSTTDSPEQASAAAVYSVGNYRILRARNPAMSQPATDVSRQLPVGAAAASAGSSSAAGRRSRKEPTDAQFATRDCSSWPSVCGFEPVQPEIVNGIAGLAPTAMRAECRGWLAIGTNSAQLSCDGHRGRQRHRLLVDVSEPMITLRATGRITSLAGAPHTWPHTCCAALIRRTPSVGRPTGITCNFAGHAGKLDRNRAHSGRQYRPPLAARVWPGPPTKAALDADRGGTWSWTTCCVCLNRKTGAERSSQPRLPPPHGSSSARPAHREEPAASASAVPRQRGPGRCLPAATLGRRCLPSAESALIRRAAVRRFFRALPDAPRSPRRRPAPEDLRLADFAALAWRLAARDAEVEMRGQPPGAAAAPHRLDCHREAGARLLRQQTLHPPAGCAASNLRLLAIRPVALPALDPTPKSCAEAGQSRAAATACMRCCRGHRRGCRSAGCSGAEFRSPAPCRCGLPMNDLLAAWASAWTGSAPSLLEHRRAGTWRAAGCARGDRRHLAEALAGHSTGSGTGSRQIRNSIASDVAAATDRMSGRLWLGQIERLNEILLRPATRSDACAPPRLAPLLWPNHERQVRLAEPDSTFPAGGAPNSKSGAGLVRSSWRLSSHAAADCRRPRLRAAKGADRGSVLKTARRRILRRQLSPDCPPQFLKDKENLLPA